MFPQSLSNELGKKKKIKINLGFVPIWDDPFASLLTLSVWHRASLTRVQVSILPHHCHWHHHGDVFARQNFPGAAAEMGFSFSIPKATWAKSPAAAEGPSHMPELLPFAPGRDTYPLAKSFKHTSTCTNTDFPSCKWKISGTHTSQYTSRYIGSYF